MTSENMDEIKLIPTEMLQLIPYYGGDMMQLNLFIRQCEYVISKYGGNSAQNKYVMHSIMSRLVDRAAVLISEHDEIDSWVDLKKLFIKHFGDPRSEDCIYMEMQNTKIKPGESYYDFYNRIKSVSSALVAKMSHNADSRLKQGKMLVYDEAALEIFLYNLPEKIFHNVRFKSPKTLEDALTYVLEEVNFQEQYNMRHRNVGYQHTGMPATAFGNTNAASRPAVTFDTAQHLNRPHVAQLASFGSQPQGAPRPLQFGATSVQSAARTASPFAATTFGLAPHPFKGNLFGGNKPPQKPNNDSNMPTEVATSTAKLPETQEE